MTDLHQSTGHAVSDTVDALILDLLAWIGPDPRPYAEVPEAWRTSCPRLPVWEEANDRAFIVRHRAPGRGVLVSVSASGAGVPAEAPPTGVALTADHDEDLLLDDYHDTLCMLDCFTKLSAHDAGGAAARAVG